MAHVPFLLKSKSKQKMYARELTWEVNGNHL